MKLLKFVGGDAPQTFHTMKFDGHSLTFPNLPKKWVAVNHTSSHPVTGSYWLIDDDGKPVCQLNDVIVMKGELIPGYQPAAVRDDHVEGADIRSKYGKMFENARVEYGMTNSKAGGVVSMNQQEQKAAYQEKAKKERATVANQIEKGEEAPAKKSRKEK